jgi:hypothetical protein
MKKVLLATIFIAQYANAQNIILNGIGIDGQPCQISYQVSEDGEVVENLKATGISKTWGVDTGDRTEEINLDGYQLNEDGKKSEFIFTKDFSINPFGTPSYSFEFENTNSSNITVASVVTLKAEPSSNNPNKISILGKIKVGAFGLAAATVGKQEYTCTNTSTDSSDL